MSHTIAQLGKKPVSESVTFKNADTVTLPNGNVVCLIFNGTDDGLAVVLPSTAGANIANTLSVGVVTNPGTDNGIAPGKWGQVVTFGLCLNAKITTSTRTATTASFASWAALGIGDYLAPETVGNGLAFQGKGTAASNGSAVEFVLAQSIASSSGAASTTSNTSLVMQQTAKVFLRTM